MTIDRYGHLEGWARQFPGDGIRMERPVEGGESAPRRRLLQRRLVVDGERTYSAYSADELIEIDSLAHRGRPGRPF